MLYRCQITDSSNHISMQHHGGFHTTRVSVHIIIAYAITHVNLMHLDIMSSSLIDYLHKS